MSDDLIARLREPGVHLPLRKEAADRIEALAAKCAVLAGDVLHAVELVSARDKRIEELETRIVGLEAMLVDAYEHEHGKL